MENVFVYTKEVEVCGQISGYVPADDRLSERCG